MGISEADLTFLAKLEDFKHFRSVCDLGYQHLFCNDEGAFRSLGFGDVPMRGWACDLWKALGWRAVSLDLVGDAVRFDLNKDRVPFWWRKFDLVTNCGTTEHVANQGAAFKAVHDLCKVGGVMYHQIPVAGYAAHGLFRYNPRFFRMLAKANGYQILSWFVAAGNGTSDPDPGPDTLENLEYWRTHFPSSDVGARIALRKLTHAKFRTPLDLPE